jgi:ribosomal protein L11 methyltransferase
LGVHPWMQSNLLKLFTPFNLLSLDYIELNLRVRPFSEGILEIFTAELSNLGFEGFAENNKALLAYIPLNLFSNKILFELIQNPALKNYSIDVSHTLIKEQNWNQLWESNFEPILVDNQCLIKAPFHKESLKQGIEIIIEPKMSFGTGHHATTQLMVSDILKLDLKKKTILDIGTGTGILAIIAAKKGAAKIIAVDNDEWSYNNCLENCSRNNSEQIETILGNSSAINNNSFDVIFANINKPVISSEINSWIKMMNSGGLMLISGILETDEQDIISILPSNLHILEKKTLNNWLFLRLQKYID